MRNVLLGVVVAAMVIVNHGTTVSAALSNTIRLSNSARQAGMGGTCQSLADDGQAPLCNPAGMAFQEGGVFDFSGALGLAHTRYEDPQNNARSGGEGGAGVNGVGDFGFVQRLNDLPLAYGIGYYTYAGSRLKYDINSTLMVPAGSEDNDFDLTLIHNRIIPAVAVRVTDEFALGAGYVRAYQSTAIAAPHQFQSTINPAGLAGQRVYLDVDSDGWGQGGVFGALVKLGERTRLGLAYTTQMKVELKGRSEFIVRNSPVLAALGIPEGTRTDLATSATWKWPQTLGVGVSHQANPQWLVAFDWQWFDWSAAADKIEATFYNGNNALVNATLLAVTGQTFIRDKLRLHYRDAFVYKFGTEYRPNERWALRAGYSFSTNPVSDETLGPLSNGNLQHTLSLGAGTTVKGWDVDAAWSHAFLNEQVTETSAWQGGEFANSQTSAGGDVFFLTMRRRF